MIGEGSGQAGCLSDVVQVSRSLTVDIAKVVGHSGGSLIVSSNSRIGGHFDDANTKMGDLCL